MIRLRVIPLPPVTVGEFTETPFVLLIDRAAGNDYDMATIDALRTETGARTVLVFEDPVDAEPVLSLSEDEQADLVRRALHVSTAPRYEVTP